MEELVEISDFKEKTYARGTILESIFLKLTGKELRD
jgi:hypothetical protein